MSERDNLNLYHGDEVVGVVIKHVNADGTVRYVIRGDAEMREAIMRICTPTPHAGGTDA